ncbi:MAG: Eco57I restriction-modification methylase domain-containing protein, partial [Ktedonobacteraceae bacterium]
AELEALAVKGETALLDFVVEKTGRSRNAIKNVLANSSMLKRFSRDSLLAACDNDQPLFERVLAFAGLLRTDTFGNPVVITTDSVYVTQGNDRRSTGTHYTPRSLTEPIVQHTLDPLVYIGPAEGKPQEEWQLRTSAEILNLKVCDMAMGSGAFLVQVCRYLSTKLVEAWEHAEQQLPGKPKITPGGLPSTGAPNEMLLPNDPNERLAIAMRIVCEHCIYGVDKNPVAVEMAKLSLWLITLNKNHPFTFLDHALRCGDSLLGVNLRQLTSWSMDAMGKGASARQMVWIEPLIKDALDTALKLRRQISTMPENDVRDIEAKARLLAEAEEAMEVVKLGADLLIATTLCDSKRQAVFQDTMHVEYTVLVSAYEEARKQKFSETGKDEGRVAFKKLREEVEKLLMVRRPFHWPLEFPEVFAAGIEEERGFAAIVSNPPFQGGSKITGTLGTNYRDYLIEYVAQGKRGNADLCAFFFLRATALVKWCGSCGLLATNTISEGDTRDTGLDQIIASGWTVPRSIPSHKWPGMASLEVAHIWLWHDIWHGTYILDENPVEFINASLKPEKTILSKPYSIIYNKGKASTGSKIYGPGFILESNLALALIAKDERNKEVVFPYLNADDLNSNPDQSASRWVIDFKDWPLAKAETYFDCIKIVQEKVKPERIQSTNITLREKWWLYERRRAELYDTISKMKRVLAIPIHTKYMLCAWVPIGILYSTALCLITTQSDADFAFIQCTFHHDWAGVYGSSLRNDLRYTPSDCFETFPFPESTEGLNDIGEHYYTHRQSTMLSRQEGLTKTYNRFHYPYETAGEIMQLRQLHKEMDEAVAQAYGWDDLVLEHGFHETKQGVRYTISEEARREVLGRLLQLNHERYAEEVKMGLHEKGGRKNVRMQRTGEVKSIEGFQGTLFE